MEVPKSQIRQRELSQNSYEGHGGEAQKGGTINYDPSQLSSAKDILDLILIKIAD